MRLHHDGAISSVGRASPLHGGGRRFEPVIAHHFCGPLAQLVEQLTFNQLVAGSNPARPTTSYLLMLYRITYCGPLAQLVEQLTFNQLVAGSNPARPTT